MGYAEADPVGLWGKRIEEVKVRRCLIEVLAGHHQAQIYYKTF